VPSGRGLERTLIPPPPHCMGEVNKTYLKMVRSGKTMVYAQFRHEFVIELVYKLTTLVSGQYLGQTHSHEDLRKSCIMSFMVIATSKQSYIISEV